MMKLTKKVALEAAIVALSANEIQTYTMGEAQFSAEEIKEKLVAMIEALDKKPAGDKGMTEQQKQNLGYKGDILATLADGKTRTATELLNEVPSFAGTNMTNQRVSALLRQLILDGKVKKDMVKGKAMFGLVEGA